MYRCLVSLMEQRHCYCYSGERGGGGGGGGSSSGGSQCGEGGSARGDAVAQHGHLSAWAAY